MLPMHDSALLDKGVTEYGSLSQRRLVRCAVDGAGNLQLPRPLHTFAITSRDMKDFRAPALVSTATAAEPIYTVHRYICDQEPLVRANVKFDLTVLLTNRIGEELPRTRGHYHLTPPERSSPYFDVYQVHSGLALIQLSLPSSRAPRVMLVVAGKRDILFIPPEMGHVAYNAGPCPLLLTNWCTRNEHLDYDSMRCSRGPAYRIADVTCDTIVVKANSGFSRQRLPICILRPVELAQYRRILDIRSQLILDWADTCQFISMLNADVAADSWFARFYRPAEHYEVRLVD